MTKPSSLPYRPGVGLALFNAQGLVFAARRKDTPDAWQMPQGGIDPGETPEQAMRREMKEEIGTDKAEILTRASRWVSYDLPPSLLGKVWGGRYRGQSQMWFALKFLGRDADIDIETEHPEFDAWRWMELTELVAGIVPFKRALYQIIGDEFAPIADRIRAAG